MSEDLDALVSSSVRIVVLDDTTDRSDSVPRELKSTSVSHHSSSSSSQNTIKINLPHSYEVDIDFPTEGLLEALGKLERLLVFSLVHLLEE